MGSWAEGQGEGELVLIPVCPRMAPILTPSSQPVTLCPLLPPGNSVCAFIHGFEPYFYAEKPRSWGHEALEDLHRELNVRRLWGRKNG